MVAAGSCDKIIRVWSLQNYAPVIILNSSCAVILLNHDLEYFQIAVLSSHGGMITTVAFSPHPGPNGYLISTSGDGSIAFWSYSRDGQSICFEYDKIIVFSDIV